MGTSINIIKPEQLLTASVLWVREIGRFLLENPDYSDLKVETYYPSNEPDLYFIYHGRAYYLFYSLWAQRFILRYFIEKDNQTVTSEGWFKTIEEVLDSIFDGNLS